MLLMSLTQIASTIDDVIRQAAQPLKDLPADYAPLIKMVAKKSFVLLGESTHGTREFYQARVDISKRLILDHGLNAIAIEGDWPAAARVNRYVRGQGFDTNANQALSDFKRFPLWMWRNTVVSEFVEWLREHNHQLPVSEQIGFYGLDMYSMYESVAMVLQYLDQRDPQAAQAARVNYGCLEHLGQEQHYGYGVSLGRQKSCEEEVVQQLMALREQACAYTGGAGEQERNPQAEDEYFEAEQNARLVTTAESYYRTMFDDRLNTWNLRDSHMMETLDNLHQHLSSRLTRPARIAVWAHNSHLGDARATDMNLRGEHNLGQLARARYGNACATIGFTTYNGTVTAASSWDGPAERKRMRSALPDSVEDVFHRTQLKDFFLPLHGRVAQHLRQSRWQRAIGVIYLPQHEMASHYLRTRMADQFDAVVHIDETQAVEPLDPTSEWITGERGTYPFMV
jgi:erythromycin esterase-like protein